MDGILSQGIVVEGCMRCLEILDGGLQDFQDYVIPYSGPLTRNKFSCLS
jgi:hypothetical protein